MVDIYILLGRHWVWCYMLMVLWDLSAGVKRRRSGAAGGRDGTRGGDRPTTRLFFFLCLFKEMFRKDKREKSWHMLLNKLRLYIYNYMYIYIASCVNFAANLARLKNASHLPRIDMDWLGAVRCCVPTKSCFIEKATILLFHMFSLFLRWHVLIVDSYIWYIYIYIRNIYLWYIYMILMCVFFLRQSRVGRYLVVKKTQWRILVARWCPPVVSVGL